MVSFKTGNSKLNKVFSNYFDLAIENWEFDNQENEYISDEYYKGQQCTQQHYSEDLKDYYDHYKLDEAICLNKDFTIKLLETG